MRVPMLDLHSQMDTLGHEIKEAVNQVIDSTRYILGPEVTTLEERIAEYTGAGYAVGVSSGTDALLISLMALDIGPGDIVLTTDYSFFATAGTIARLNATPVFLDIDPVTYNISPDALRSSLDDLDEPGRRRVKAIVPVHLYGQCADMDPIMEVAERYGVEVIEDAAQAIGAGYPSKDGLRSAGTIGAMGCFSFFPSKNLGGLGDGGMVVTNRESLYRKLLVLRNHGARPKYYHSMIGGNFRLDPIQAAALRVKLPHLETWHSMRRERAQYYDEKLRDLPLKTPAAVKGRECHIYNQYVVEAPDRRDDLVRFLSSAEIATAIYYPVPFHQQECFSGLSCNGSDFRVSQHAATHTLALPLYPELTKQKQDYVVQKLREFYE